MNGLDLVAILPLLVLGGFSVVILLAAAFFRSHRTVAVLALAAFGLAAASLPFVSPSAPRRVTTLLILDGTAYFYMGLVLVAAFAVTAMSYGYLKKREGDQEEYYILLVIATLGACFLAAAGHFASFFLGLEVLSVSLYALVGYLLLSERSIEAAIKYLVLAAASAAFLVFGMALIYAETGMMEFARLAAVEAPGHLFLGGLALILVGVGFKLALAPFHMWTADVYEGAPAPVTAFIATVSKGAMFAVLLRAFLPILPRAGDGLWTAFVFLAILSMCVGNLLALLQTNVKRILAYSSIAHLGYLLVAFLAAAASPGGPEGARDRAVAAATYYLAAYFVSTLAAFGIITALSGAGRDSDEIEDYRGLFGRRPWAAAVLTAAILSLAGMPMTAGFLGKFYVVLAGVGSALWTPVLVLVGASAVGLYYYLRIVVSIYLSSDSPAVEKDRVPYVTFTALEGLLLGSLTVLVFWLGLWPGPVLELIRESVRGMVP